jgi:hypothetical protein
MAKFRSNKTALIGGQISPTAFGRTDLPFYPYSCKTLKNMIPLMSGGAYRRPGSKYEGSISGATNYIPRLLPFVVSRDEAYCLYLTKAVGGNGTVGGFRPGSNTGTSTSITCTGTHDYLWAAVDNSFYDYDEISEVQYAQSVDVMTLVHPRRIPKRISRTSASNFTIADMFSSLTGTALRESIPFLEQNTSATTLSIDVATVGVGRVLTASAALFTADSVGTYYKVNNGGTYGLCKVTDYTNSTTVTVQVYVAFGAAATPVATWWESAWSNRRGWPRAVGFFRQRLVFAGTTYRPDTLWFSQTGNYDVMSISDEVDPRDGPTGDEPFSAELAQTQLNQIQWLYGSGSLIVGTSSQPWVIAEQFNNGTDGFGCNNKFASAQVAPGSSYQQPVAAFGELIHVTSSQDEVRSLDVSDSERQVTDEPLQVFFDEYPKVEAWGTTLGNRKFRSIAWDGSRKTLWCSDTAGNLFGMTREKKLGYDATSTGSIIGTGGADGTMDPMYLAPEGSVMSLAVVPNPSTSSGNGMGADDLWLVVKRKINSAWVYHFERIIGKQALPDAVTDIGYATLYCVDAAVSQAANYPSTEDYVFGGLTHLRGETPHGTASNSYGLFTVTGSAVTAGGETTMQTTYPTNITGERTTVVFGLPFDSVVEPVRIEAGSQIGSAQGALKRIHEVNIRFYKTMHAKVGSDSSNLETLNFRTASQPMGQSAPLKTGDYRVKFDSSYDRDGLVYILCDKPLPFAVVSISAEGMTYD